jgi:hypothetical protein
MRKLTILAISLMALAVPAAGMADVTSNASTKIQVVYSTGRSSAAGLRAKIGGLITWRWKVGSNTKLGRWPVIVNCGTSGPSRRFTLRVVR